MDKTQVLLFGGTTEGRKLAQWLAEQKVAVLLCVATEYGEKIIEQRPFLEVQAGRMDAADMEELIRSRRISLAVDATHPYAREVSDNLDAACRRTGTEYLRLIRQAVATQGIKTVETAFQAAAELARTGARALLTVGSKELEAFTAVPDYGEKLVARVLPDPEALAKCQALGFCGRNLVGMQGPFSHGMNVAMLREYNTQILVTKDSGGPGGLTEKLSAAREVGAAVLLIKRPNEKGLGLEQMIEHLCGRLEIPADFFFETPHARFPVFLDINCRKVAVIGGGTVAARRVVVLLEHGANITVVSPKALPELEDLANKGRIVWIPREYRTGDLAGCILAVAATASREVNRQAGLDAVQEGILVSVADRRDEGNFWFPAIVRKKGLVLALVSEKGEHHKVREAAEFLRRGEVL